MELMMYLGNDLIESIPLDDTRISRPGYLGHFKRKLKKKYYELIKQVPFAPEFFVINPSIKTQKAVTDHNQNRVPIDLHYRP